MNRKTLCNSLRINISRAIFMSNKLRSPFGNFTPFTSHFHPLSKPSQDEIRPHKVDTIHFHEWKEELEMEEKQPVDLKAICALQQKPKSSIM